MIALGAPGPPPAIPALGMPPSPAAPRAPAEPPAVLAAPPPPPIPVPLPTPPSDAASGSTPMLPVPRDWVLSRTQPTAAHTTTNGKAQREPNLPSVFDPFQSCVLRVMQPLRQDGARP